MKTNNFKVKKIKENEIIVEEERETKNGLILFLRKYGSIVFISCLFLSLSIFFIGIGLTISNLGNSSKIVTVSSGVTTIFDDSDTINELGQTPITNNLAARLFKSRYGVLILTEGAIIETKRIVLNDKTIIFYSDKSALVKYNNNNYQKIDSINGNYGIYESGLLVVGVKTKDISLTNTVNTTNNVIYYYSDGTCEIANNLNSVIYRNSNDINVVGDLIISDLLGVSVVKEIDSTNNITYYTDGTIKVVKNNNTYIVRNNDDFSINNNTVTFNNDNMASVINEITLTDNTKLIYYSDGSVEVITNTNSVMIRKSGYLITNGNDNIIEVMVRDTSYKISERIVNNGKVLYFDDGSAVVINNNGTYSYYEESGDIKYNNNSVSSTTGTNITDSKLLPNGTHIVNLPDDKVLVYNNEESYITDSEKLVYDIDGNISAIVDEIDDGDDYIEYKSLTISNTVGSRANYKVVIEETSDYSIYNYGRLEPQYIKYQMMVGSTYVSNTILNSNVWSSSLGGGLTVPDRSYILYEGSLENLEEIKIDLCLWLDADTITNTMMNKLFAGTIKVYTEAIIE